MRPPRSTNATPSAMNKQKNAFTLIELLVVVSIIALLVSILIPALGKAKQQAETTVCLSNMRQIGFAANFYLSDNDEFLPRGDWAAGNGITWFELFMPYLGQEHARASGDYREVEIYLCPSFPTTGYGFNNVSNAEQTVTYVVNAWTFNSKQDMFGTQQEGPAKISVFKRDHSETIYLADNDHGYWRPVIQKSTDPEIQRIDVFRPSHIAGSDQESLSDGRRVANDRHRDDGCNVLYLDWHADWVRAINMTVTMWKDK